MPIVTTHNVAVWVTLREQTCARVQADGITYAIINCLIRILINKLSLENGIIELALQVHSSGILLSGLD